MIGLSGLVHHREKNDMTTVDDAVSVKLDWFSCGPISNYITVMATLDLLLSCSP